MKAPLLPPLNLRRRIPQVCGHCMFFEYPGDGTSRCKRPCGPIWDLGDGIEWERTCNRFVQYRTQKR